jgi:hypothetical protein
MKMNESTFNIIKAQAVRLAGMQTSLYHKKFEGLDLNAMQSQQDFEKLPFTDKADLRDCYPLGLAAVPMRDVVRIHSSSGTTGVPVIIPYTKKDVDDWAIQFKRCYEIAGITPEDRIQITPGYGLWTAGIRVPAGRGAAGRYGHSHGAGQYRKAAAVYAGYGFDRALRDFFLCAFALRGNCQTWYCGQNLPEKGRYRVGTLGGKDARPHSRRSWDRAVRYLWFDGNLRPRDRHQLFL